MKIEIGKVYMTTTNKRVIITGEACSKGKYFGFVLQDNGRRSVLYQEDGKPVIRDSKKDKDLSDYTLVSTVLPQKQGGNHGN